MTGTTQGDIAPLIASQQKSEVGVEPGLTFCARPETLSAVPRLYGGPQGVCSGFEVLGEAVGVGFVESTGCFFDNVR